MMHPHDGKTGLTSAQWHVDIWMSMGPGLGGFSVDFEMPHATYCIF